MSTKTRPALALVVLALPAVLVAMDISLLTIALPSMGADLGASSVELLWMSDVYGLLVAGTMIAMGSLADRFGRRRLILVCAAVFAVASAVGAFATTPELVIAARAVMGIAGSGIMPAAMALIGVLYPEPARRAAAMGAFMTVFLVSMAISPLVGGVLLAHFWWGSVFLLGVPVMVITLLVAPRVLPEFRDPDPAPLDVPGALTSVAALLLLVGSLKAAVGGSSLPVVLATLLLGLALAAAFVRRQRTAAHPLVPTDLFRDPRLVRSMVVLLLTALVMGGTSIYVTLYLQDVRGQSPLRAALWLVPQMVAMIVASNLGPWLAARVGRPRVCEGGLVLMSLGFVLYAVLPSGAASLPLLALATMCATAGIGAAFPLLMDDLIGSAPPERAGSAASLAQVFNELGIALGLVLLGSLGTLVYRTSLGAPSGSPESDGIVRALLEAARNGDSALREAAQESYATAFHVVGLAGCVVMAVVLLLTFRGRAVQSEAWGGASRSRQPTAAQRPT
jgi:MFS transporter, DHA2 family, multidrug resistance protein